MRRIVSRDLVKSSSLGTEQNLAKIMTLQVIHVFENKRILYSDTVFNDRICAELSESEYHLASPKNERGEISRKDNWMASHLKK